MKRTAIVIAALLLVAVGVVLIFADSLKWHGGDIDKNGSAITPGDLATVSTNCGVGFPSGVRGEHFRWLGSGIDPGLFAKLWAPAASESQLLASIASMPNEDIHLSGSPEPVWWKPSTGTILADRTYQRKACYVRIVLCKEQDGLMVYVKWFSV